MSDQGNGGEGLGENHFLFTFHQASGKTKALEEGPWMLSNDLIVVADFDGSNTLDNVDVSTIPIWVRVMKLPLGMRTDRETAVILGGEIGSYMDVDLDENNSYVGCFLHIKIRMDIMKPLMRGVIVSVGGRIGGVHLSMNSSLNSAMFVWHYRPYR